MKSIKLVGLSGIIGKIRGFKEMFQLRLEISQGLKCNKQKVGVKPAKLATNFLAAVSGDGTTEGGLGKVVYSVGKL